MRQLTVAITLALLTIISCPATEATECGWTLKLQGGWLDSSAELAGEEDAALLRAEAEGSAAFALGVEYRFAERLGIELSALFSNMNVDFSARLGDRSIHQTLKLEVMPVSLAFNLHLTPSSKIDFYIAPSISYVRYGDIEYSVEELEIDERAEIGSDSSAFGLALGIDVPFGSSGWSFSAQARTIWTDAEDEKIDPVILLVGIARHF